MCSSIRINKMDHYLQKTLVINNRELKYKGIFMPNELFDTINRALEARGYHKREKKTEELVTEQGRKSYIELRPYKKKANYAKYMIKMKILLDKVVEAVEEQDGRKRKFQKGDVTIVFDAWLLLDYESRWGMKPLVFFIKGWINKFLWKLPLEGSFPGEVAADTAYIYGHIKKLFRSYRPKEKGEWIGEEVRKQMEEEIKNPNFKD